MPRQMFVSRRQAPSLCLLCPPLLLLGLCFLIKLPKGFFPVLCKIISNTETQKICYFLCKFTSFLFSFQSLIFHIPEERRKRWRAVAPLQCSQHIPLVLGLQPWCQDRGSPKHRQVKAKDIMGNPGTGELNSWGFIQCYQDPTNVYSHRTTEVLMGGAPA